MKQNLIPSLLLLICSVLSACNDHAARNPDHPDPPLGDNTGCDVVEGFRSSLAFPHFGRVVGKIHPRETLCATHDDISDGNDNTDYFEFFAQEDLFFNIEIAAGGPVCEVIIYVWDVNSGAYSADSIFVSENNGELFILNHPTVQGYFVISHTFLGPPVQEKYKIDFWSSL